MIAEEVSALPFDLPSDWTQTTVDAEFHLILGKMLDAEKNTGVSRLYLGNKAVQWGDIDVEDLAEIKLTKSDLRRYRLVDGDLLVCEGGDIGRCAIWHSLLEECYFQKALHRVRTRGNFSIILLRYLLEYFSRTGFLLNFATQTSIAHLPKDKFQQVPLPFPPIGEQEAIAEALSDADGVVEGLERLIAKKRRIKQGAMQDLLTPKRRLPGFSGEWETLPFGQIARVKNQKIPTLADDRASKCIELDQIVSETGKLIRWSTASNRATVKYLFEPGDILFGRLRPYLRKFYFPLVSGVCSTEIWPLTPCGIAPAFLYAVVQSDPFIAAACDSFGTHMPRADWGKLVSHEVQVPIDRREQHAIGDALLDMDAEITALETRLQKARQIKEGMMQNLLTGRIRLV